VVRKLTALAAGMLRRNPASMQSAARVSSDARKEAAALVASGPRKEAAAFADTPSVADDLGFEADLEFFNVEPTSIHEVEKDRELMFDAIARLEAIAAKAEKPSRSTHRYTYPTSKFTPHPRLVGVEPNPGPREKIGQRKPSRAKARKGKKATASTRQAAAPVSKGLTVRQHAPTITAVKPYQKDGSVRVRRREYVADIDVWSSAFTAQSYAINPGQPWMHWLSSFARNFDLYHFHSLRFIYETDIGTGSAGTVMMAADYDSADPAPLSKKDMRDFMDATKGPVYDNIKYDFNARLAHGTNTLKTVRTAGVPPGGDVKTYDCGVFYLATSGVSLSLPGELSVEYDVEFFAPHLDVRESALDSAHYYQCTTGVSKTAPFGTAPDDHPTNEGRLQVEFTANGSSFYPKYSGTYLVTALASGSGLTNVSPPTIAAALGTVAPMVITPVANAAGTLVSATFQVTSIADVSSDITSGFDMSSSFSGSTVTALYFVVTRGGVA
jgi:hypothetical protein